MSVEQETISAEDVGTVEAVLTPKKEVKPVRIAQLDDGTSANFGVRANLLSSFDVDTSTITFKIFPLTEGGVGKVINWVQEGLESLTDFQKKVYLYGLMERVKSSLAPVKLPDLETTIAKQIEAIKKGEFNIRSTSDESEVTLTSWQKAYAVVKATPSTPHYDESKKHWGEINNPTVIAEVLAAWEGFSASQKNAIRKDVYVKLEQPKFELANIDAATVAAI